MAGSRTSEIQSRIGLPRTRRSIDLGVLERRRSEKLDPARVRLRTGLEPRDVDRLGAIVGRRVARAAIERLAVRGGVAAGNVTAAAVIESVTPWCYLQDGTPSARTQS